MYSRNSSCNELPTDSSSCEKQYNDNLHDKNSYISKWEMEQLGEYSGEYTLSKLMWQLHAVYINMSECN